eukprot:gene15206-17412_t
MKSILLSAFLLIAILLSVATGALPADLGTAANFAVLAGTTVTSTGTVGTVINGNIGVFPGSATTGFPPAVCNGAIVAHGVAGTAQNDLTTAYNELAGRPFNTTLSNQDLGGMTLQPRVYKFNAGANMNGILTLDARGDPAAIWPTAPPSLAPSASPSNAPTLNPSAAPSITPSLAPSAAPSMNPSLAPSSAPTLTPSSVPTVNPSAAPSVVPSVAPSAAPSVNPSASPSVTPSVAPSASPSANPSAAPSVVPSVAPSAAPSVNPSASPSAMPSIDPSVAPSVNPSASPSAMPSIDPSAAPSVTPSLMPSVAPSVTVSSVPTFLNQPTAPPSIAPSASPSNAPTLNPSAAPSITPSLAPSATPSMSPSLAPSSAPTLTPSSMPTVNPSAAPSATPSVSPSALPSTSPSAAPSTVPSVAPSTTPTQDPSTVPSEQPSFVPSASPTVTPSLMPSATPTVTVSSGPTFVNQPTPFDGLPIDLGLAEPYAILAGTTVTSTGVVGTVVTGNIGIFPGSAITGFPPAVLNGAVDAANGASGNAQGSLTTAYNQLAGMAFNTTLSNQDLGGMTLPPGVYKFDAMANMNGILTLDARGDPAAVWTVSGISLADFNANITMNTAVMKSAICETMPGVLPANIQNFAVTAGPTTRSAAVFLRRTVARALAGSSIILNYDVVVSSTQTAEQLQTQLRNAVNDGSFNTFLQNAATEQGATALTTATSDTIETETIDLAPAEPDNDNDGLTETEKMGISIAVVLGVAAIAFLLWWWFGGCAAATSTQAPVPTEETLSAGEPSGKIEF